MEKGGIPFLYDTDMERVNETRIFSHIAQNSLSASASPAAAREAIKLQSSGVLRNSPRRWVGHSESSRVAWTSSFGLSCVEQGCLFLRHRQQQSDVVSLALKQPDGRSLVQP